MTRITPYMTNRNFALLALLLSGGMLLGALGFQYLGGLEPCKLCMIQRFPHVLILAGAVDLLLFGHARWLGRMVLGALIVLYLISAGLGIYHTGVEQHWWDNAVSCAGGKSFETLEDMMNQEIVRCDKPAWSLFGITMAGYNALFSAGAALLGLLVFAVGLKRG